MNARVLRSAFAPLALTLLAGTTLARGPEPVQGYYRFPTVHGDTIVFSSENDLWKVNVAGGQATRLTTYQSNAAYARFSPDGKWLAFTSGYEGNNDVSVIRTDCLEWKLPSDEYMQHWNLLLRDWILFSASIRDASFWNSSLDGKLRRSVDFSCRHQPGFSDFNECVSFLEWPNVEYREERNYRHVVQRSVSAVLWNGNLQLWRLHWIIHDLLPRVHFGDLQRTDAFPRPNPSLFERQT